MLCARKSSNSQGQHVGQEGKEALAVTTLAAGQRNPRQWLEHA